MTDKNFVDMIHVLYNCTAVGTVEQYQYAESHEHVAGLAGCDSRDQ